MENFLIKDKSRSIADFPVIERQFSSCSMSCLYTGVLCIVFHGLLFFYLPLLAM